MKKSLLMILGGIAVLLLAVIADAKLTDFFPLLTPGWWVGFVAVVIALAAGIVLIVFGCKARKKEKKQKKAENA